MKFDFTLTNRNSTPQLKNIHLNKFPIIIPKPNNEKKLASLSKECLTLNKKLQSISRNSDRWHKLKKEIEGLDKKIDQEVYKLYGLTAEEIKKVENEF